MRTPRQTPKNNKMMALAVLVAVIVAAWFVIFR
jgi:hypothetical protein